MLPALVLCMFQEETAMSSTKDKPSALNQEPAEGSREVITHELERQAQKQPKGDSSPGAKPADRSPIGKSGDRR